MEISISETEVQQSFRSPPRRRRSTFFERRDSIVPQTMTENEDLNKQTKSVESSEKHQQDIARYYERLHSEKELWKKEVKDRRNKYHDLRQQYKMATKVPTKNRMSYSALSDEDIVFLKAKPSISKLVDSQVKLHNSVKRTMALYKKVISLDDEILEKNENKINKITEYVLENSTVELVE